MGGADEGAAGTEVSREMANGGEAFARFESPVGGREWGVIGNLAVDGPPFPAGAPFQCDVHGQDSMAQCLAGQ